MAVIEINLVGDTVENKVFLCSWKTTLKEIPHMFVFYGYMHDNRIQETETRLRPMYVLDKTSVKVMQQYTKDARVITYHLLGRGLECISAAKQNQECRKDVVKIWDNLEGIINEYKDTRKTLRCFISPTQLPSLLSLARKYNCDVNLELRMLTGKKIRFLKLRYNLDTLLKQEEKKWVKLLKQTQLGAELYQFLRPRITP